MEKILALKQSNKRHNIKDDLLGFDSEGYCRVERGGKDWK